MKPLTSLNHGTNLKTNLLKKILIGFIAACLLVSLGSLGIHKVEARSLPAGIVHSIPITITNTQSVTSWLAVTYTVGAYPYGICFDGTNIWVANNGTNSVTKLRASDGANLGTYPVGVSPYGICFDGTDIWVANQGSNNVTKLRSSDGANLGTYVVGTGPTSICFDGTNIWVTNMSSNNVTKLRASDGANLVTYALGSGPNRICFDGANIWVGNWNSNNVTKLRVSDGATMGTYAVGTQPSGICFDGSNIWVANWGSSSVTKLRASDGANAVTYTVSGEPSGMCFDGSNIWVANWQDSTVTELTASDGAILGTYAVGTQPSYICFDDTNIWVTNNLSNSVTKLVPPSGTTTSLTTTLTTSTTAPQKTRPTVTLYPASTNGLIVSINGITQAMTPGATISTISWQWGDGQTTNGVFPQTHTYAQTGTYTIAVTSTDSNGTTNSASESVSVVQQQTRPTVTLYSASADGLTVSINGVMQATTPGATITSVNWQWGDGSTSTGFFPQTHLYKKGGTYTITITVTDSNGLSASASETATVAGSVSTAPSGTAQNPPFASNGAYAKYKITYGLGVSLGGTVNSGILNGGASFTINDVNAAAQTFSVTTSYSGNQSKLYLIGGKSNASFSNPSPFPAVSQSDLQTLNQGQAPLDFTWGTVITAVSVSVPAGIFKTDELSMPAGNKIWVDNTSGLIVKQTGASFLDPSVDSMALQSSNITTTKSLQLIKILIAVVVVVIVIAVAVTLLMVRRRKSKKSAVAVTEPIKQATAKNAPIAQTPGAESSDPGNRLQQLKVMLDKGLITQEDYDEQKKKILEEYTK